MPHSQRYLPGVDGTPEGAGAFGPGGIETAGPGTAGESARLGVGGVGGVGGFGEAGTSAESRLGWSIVASVVSVDVAR